MARKNVGTGPRESPMPLLRGLGMPCELADADDASDMSHVRASKISRGAQLMMPTSQVCCDKCSGVHIVYTQRL